MLKFYNEEINYYAHDINKLWFYIQKWDGRKLLPTTIYQIDVKKDNSNGSIVIGNTVYV
jgi:hypothetical protein